VALLEIAAVKVVGRPGQSYGVGCMEHVYFLEAARMPWQAKVIISSSFWWTSLFVLEENWRQLPK
jgi:hypothetical protein